MKIVTDRIFFTERSKTELPLPLRVTIPASEIQPLQMSQLEQFLRQFREPKPPQVQEAGLPFGLPCDELPGDGESVVRG